VIPEAEEHVHEHLAVGRSGRVVVLRIDRPEKLGALSSGMVAALQEQVSRLRDDATVGAVVLTGTGRSFVAGADIAEYRGATQASFDAYQRASRVLFDGIELLPQPTIAAVNGYAFGGGFELALACDFILASETATFALPEIRLGLLPGGGGPQRLSRRAGTVFTKEAVLTGRTIAAAELLERGIATSVVPPDSLDAAALAFAETLAAMPQQAVREGKRRIDDGARQEFAAALTADQAVLSRLFRSPDGREGVAAFLEKREPVFRFPEGTPDAAGQSGEGTA
jgi:enoyl-CoA hydratase/carnithine racemase